jgi:hypothetical protein
MPRHPRLLPIWLVVSLALAGSAHAQFTGTNLIANLGAEDGPASPDGYALVADIPGWTRTGSLNVVPYLLDGSFPGPASPGPVGRGANYFAGGPDGPTASITQAVDVSSLAATIDAGALGFELGGYFGGYAGQEDRAHLIARFRDAGMATLGQTTVGDVTAADRGSVTGMLFRSASGNVPTQTRSIEVVLEAVRLAGSYNDGYADSLGLTLRPTVDVAGRAAATPTLRFDRLAPNPVSGPLRVAFQLPQAARARLELFAPDGRLCATLLDDELAAGAHVTDWDVRGPGRGLSSGIYFLKLSAGGQSAQARVVVLE